MLFGFSLAITEVLYLRLLCNPKGKCHFFFFLIGFYIRKTKDPLSALVRVFELVIRSQGALASLSIHLKVKKRRKKGKRES